MTHLPDGRYDVGESHSIEIDELPPRWLAWLNAILIGALALALAVLTLVDVLT